MQQLHTNSTQAFESSYYHTPPLPTPSPAYSSSSDECFDYYSYEMGGTTYFYPVVERELPEQAPPVEDVRQGYYDQTQLFIPSNYYPHYDPRYQQNEYAIPIDWPSMHPNVFPPFREEVGS